MKRTAQIISVLAIVLVSSCQRKELPEPVIETPDFEMSGTIGGENFQSIAGEGGLQAHAFVEQDVWGVFQYTGGFVQPNCDACPGEFLITIHSQNYHSPADQPDFTEDVYVGDYPYATFLSSTDYQTIAFYPIPSNFEIITWQFPEAIVSDSTNPIQTFNGFGPIDVTMSYVLDTQCAATITQTICAGAPTSYAFPVDMIVPDPSTVILQNLLQTWPEGLIVTDIQLDGASIVVADELVLTITPLIQHEITVSFVNPDGIVGRYSVSAVFTPENCILPFYYTYVEDGGPELGVVTIRYVHANGEVYSSIHPSNGMGNSNFEITSIEPYSIPINGQPSYRVGVAMNGFLSNINNIVDTLMMDNVEGKVIMVGSN
jgi:hypothetical protein